jgi:hypothetical protein
MTTSKKKKSSLRITRPHIPSARGFIFHHRNKSGPSKTRSQTQTVVSPVILGESLSKHPESDNSLSEYFINQTDIEPNDPANTEGKEKSKQRKRTMGVAMEEWLTYRDTYLQEMLRHDGREGQPQTFCAECGNNGDFSCYDCAYSLHYCQGCLVNHHRLMPLHRIRVWKLILSVIWYLKLL